MSLPALNASLASAPPPAEYSRDLGGQSAGGSKFTEMVNALAGEDPQPDAHAAATPAAASPQDQGSSSESTSKANESPSIDSGLARLVYGAVVSPAFGGAASRASGGRGASASSSQSADDSTAAVSSSVPATQNGADANSVLAGLLYGALASPAATAFGQFVARSAGGESAAQPGASGSNAAAANGSTTPAGALLRALAGRGADMSADQATGGSAAAAPAPATQNGAGANFALAGAFDGPVTIQMAANGDASLGVSAVRSRTYLGFDGAAQSEAKNPISRSQARSAADGVVAAEPGAAATVGGDTAASTSMRDETPSEKRSASGRDGSPSASLADPSAGAGPAATGLAASSGVLNVGGNPAIAGVGPVALSQLADRLAAEASGLTSQTAPSSSAPTTAAASAQPVKELQIDLEPSDLGAVSVKMRMAQGQLSVVMEVAKPSTLNAIENERSAIADRLGLSAQSLDTLIIRPTTTTQTSAESNNAQDRKSGSQDNGQSDPNRPSQGNERQPSRGQDAAGRWNRQAAARQSPSGRGFGDLVV